MDGGEGSKGCGCTSDEPTPLALGLFGLLALRRRRRGA
jgi:MYXO-CTERM domain-containing protein